ncbi:MAG: hypothetical protein KC503_35065 [Myxococcales bacterium]|nr:hypothetical protein [Myxococcales bacterium]
MAHKRKLRNYLLNRKYQLRFMLIMVLLTSVLTAGLGHFWYAEMRTTSRMLEVKALADMMSDAEVKKVQEKLQREDRKRLLLLVGFGVLLALIISAYSIISTHKVAGPLFKMTRHMHDIADNRHYSLWGLRKGDQLKDFFEDFKAMSDALRERIKYEVTVLEKAIDEIKAKTGDDADEAVKAQLLALRTLVAEKLASLERASDQTVERAEPPPASRADLKATDAAKSDDGADGDGDGDSGKKKDDDA